MEPPIPITTVEIGPDEERLVLEVLRSGQLAQGPVVQRLEAAFARLCRVEHAIAVSSGTTALVATLRALGLRQGDEVITTPFTFVATLNAILEAGATARFADIEDASYTIDPVSVEALAGARTKVLMPVHLYGQPADMPALMEIARRRELRVVEDAAQAHGAEIMDCPVGSFGVGCFSFYATKNVSTGEGGMITTNDGGLADHLRLLRNQGMRRKYDYEIVGANYRLTDLQAALALPQLERLGETTKLRRENADSLSSLLAGLPGVSLPQTLHGRTHVFHQYTIRIGPQAALERDEVASRLADRGISTGIYYPRAVYHYRCYREHPRVVADPTPRADAAAAQVLSLPVHASLKADDIDRIAAGLWDILG